MTTVKKGVYVRLPEAIKTGLEKEAAKMGVSQSVLIEKMFRYWILSKYNGDGEK